MQSDVDAQNPEKLISLVGLADMDILLSYILHSSNKILSS